MSVIGNFTKADGTDVDIREINGRLTIFEGERISQQDKPDRAIIAWLVNYIHNREHMIKKAIETSDLSRLTFQRGIRINDQPAIAKDVVAIGRKLDEEDGGYPVPPFSASSQSILFQAGRFGVFQEADGCFRVVNIITGNVYSDIFRIRSQAEDLARNEDMMVDLRG